MLTKGSFSLSAYDQEVSDLAGRSEHFTSRSVEDVTSDHNSGLVRRSQFSCVVDDPCRLLPGIFDTPLGDTLASDGGDADDTKHGIAYLCLANCPVKGEYRLFGAIGANH